MPRFRLSTFVLEPLLGNLGEPWRFVASARVYLEAYWVRP